MPGGGRSNSRPLALVGAVVAVVAIAGTTVLGWEFGYPSGDVLPFALGVGACTLALFASWYARYS